MDKSKESNEVFVKTTNISEKIQSDKIKEKIDIHREKRRFDEKYKNVKSLIDSDSDEDAADWYERTAKRSRKNEQVSTTKSPQKPNDGKHSGHRSSKLYTENHLKGLAIGHKSDSIKEGQQIVLTLRDKDVLAEDEDVLENVNIVDEEKAAKNVENKTKRIDYRPYDDEEFDEFGIIKKSSLLNKYDEELEGPKVEMFRIGSSLQTNKSFLKTDSESGNKVSLNFNDLKIANEYYTQEEMVKFKKPSKKKGQLRKRNPIKPTNDESFDPNSIQTESRSEKPSVKKSRTESTNDRLKKIQLDLEKIDDNFVGPDEDLSNFTIEDEAENELQSVLHKARKLKMKEKFVDPALNIAKIVGQVKPEKKEEDDGDENMNLEQNNQIVMNATAEFCRNLGESITIGRGHQRNVINDGMKFEENDAKTADMVGDDDDDDDEDGVNGKDSDSEDDTAKYRNNWNEVDVKMEEYEEESNEEQPVPIESQPILEEEPDVSVGVAGALKLAMTKGYLDKDTGKSFGATKSSIIAAQSYTIEEKFYEEDRMGRRDRYSGSISEFREKSGYRPDFKLDYVDEKGRMMNQKEAFRYLSHKFHGKGPGKNKIDKRMKKMEQESKLRQMSSIDTPLNTVKLLQHKQKELQTPYIVLSGQKAGSNMNQLTKISKK